MEDLLEASHGLDVVTKKINDIVDASLDLVLVQRPEVEVGLQSYCFHFASVCILLNITHITQLIKCSNRVGV